MEYYRAIKKNDFSTFAAIWTALESIILSEISRERQLSYDFSHLRNIRTRKIGRRRKGRRKGGVIRGGNET